MSYRQCDYWARSNVLVPSVMDANGCGTQRLYSAQDVQLLTIAKQILDAGLKLEVVRSMLRQLRDLAPADLAGRFLVIAGDECLVVSDPTVALVGLEAGQVVHVLRPAPFRELALA